MKEEEILAKKSAMPNKKTNQQAPPKKIFNGRHVFAFCSFNFVLNFSCFIMSFLMFLFYFSLFYFLWQNCLMFQLVMQQKRLWGIYLLEKKPKTFEYREYPFPCIGNADLPLLFFLQKHLYHILGKEGEMVPTSGLIHP